jgi:hypothetical protein
MSNYPEIAEKAIQTLAKEIAKMSPEEMAGATTVIKWWARESRTATYTHLGSALAKFLLVLEQAELLRNLMQVIK